MYFSHLHPVFNVSLLKPYHNPSSFHPHANLAWFKLDDNPALSIKSILDTWKIDHYYKYFVQWKNQFDSKNSWISVSNIPLINNKLINCFHRWHPYAFCSYPIILSKSMSQLEELLCEESVPSVHHLPPYSPSSASASQPSYYMPFDQTTTCVGCISCPAK